MRARWRRLVLVVYDCGSDCQDFGDFYAETRRHPVKLATNHARRFARESSSEAEGFALLEIDVPRGVLHELDMPQDSAAWGYEDDPPDGTPPALRLERHSLAHRMTDPVPPPGFRRLWLISYSVEGTWQPDGEWAAEDGDWSIPGGAGQRRACKAAREMAFDQAGTNARDFGYGFVVTPIDVPAELFP